MIKVIEKEKDLIFFVSDIKKGLYHLVLPFSLKSFFITFNLTFFLIKNEYLTCYLLGFRDISSHYQLPDALSGFKLCQGYFPNKITTYTYTPHPFVTGQVVTVHIGGKATATIEKGAFYKITGYLASSQKT